MSTFKHPVGPQPASTYWRRRLVVGLGLLAAIIIVILLVVRPGAQEPAADPVDPAGASDTEATTAPADVEPVACTATAVEVMPVTDSETYGADSQPQLSLSITNTGAAACTFPVGSDVQEYIVTSGEEQIWSSTDCQTEAAALEQLLEPGVAVTTTPFAWNRTRSDAAACDAERSPVIAGGATYRLDVSVNGVESTESRPFILE
jgi:hypothetical protein